MRLLKMERSPKPHVVCMTHNDDEVVLEAEETIEKKGKAKGTSLLRAARLSLMPSRAESLTRIVYASMPDHDPAILLEDGSAGFRNHETH